MVFNYHFIGIASKECEVTAKKGNCQKKRKLLKSENSTRIPQQDIANKMYIVQIYHPTQYLHISMTFKYEHEGIHND